MRPWWLVIVLITRSLGASHFPEEVHGITSTTCYALGFASALLLFASILARALGYDHAQDRHDTAAQGQAPADRRASTAVTASISQVFVGGCATASVPSDVGATVARTLARPGSQSWGRTRCPG